MTFLASTRPSRLRASTPHVVGKWVRTHPRRRALGLRSAGTSATVDVAMLPAALTTYMRIRGAGSATANVSLRLQPVQHALGAVGV